MLKKSVKKLIFLEALTMEKTKLQTITNLFENKEIRSIWNSEKEEYYYSVVDVIAALTNSDYQKIKKLLEMVKR